MLYLASTYVSYFKFACASKVVSETRPPLPEMYACNKESIYQIMYVPLYKLRGRSCARHRRAHVLLRGPSSMTVRRPNDPKGNAATRRPPRGDLVAHLYRCGV